MNAPSLHGAVLHSPFHSRLVAACETNEWYRWKAYTAVACFTDVELEYFAIRNGAGLFDLTPMSKYRIRGADAGRYLDRLLTRNIATLAPGRVAYAVWCNDAGQVIDDGTVFHLRESDYRLCAQERHLDWLLSSAIGFDDVQIEDETDRVAAVALQGPTACSILKRMGFGGVEALKPFGLRDFAFESGEVMVSRTGFTGDLGYELWVEPQLAEALWDRLLQAGRHASLRPIGTHALEMARIEAGYIQAGVDFVPAEHAVRVGHTRSPLELGLDWLVDFDKPNFTGRRALLEERARGPRYRLVRLDVEGNKPARDSFIYSGRRKVVGTVTSAMWSPTAKANIALASLQTPYGRAEDRLHAEIYYQRELKWKRVMARCRVVDGPFFNPPRRRQTPAPDF